MKFEDLRIPSDVTNELSLVRLFVDDNLQFHKNNHTFSELMEELNRTITKHAGRRGRKSKEYHIIGSCLIDPTAKIHPGTTITGPCIIGPNCEVGPNAYIRHGTILGSCVRVGFGAEVKQSIIGSNVRITHFSYVGNSLIGNDCEISANVVVSVKGFDSLKVRLWTSQDRYITTNCEKLGTVAGDNVKIGSGCIIMPGTYIGSNSIIWPHIVVHKHIPENSIIKTGRRLSRDQNSCEPESNSLGLLKLSIDSYHRETDRFWSRNTVFVAVNVALISVFAAYGARISTSGTVLLSAFGLAAAWAWFQTVRMGKHYSEREELDAKKLVESREDYSTILRRWTKNPRVKRPRGPRPTTCVGIVSLATIVLWLGVIAVLLLSLKFNIKLLS